MKASCLHYLPDKDFLLHQSMREWSPEGHLKLVENLTSTMRHTC